jgi:hypothetical protein
MVNEVPALIIEELTVKLAALKKKIRDVKKACASERARERETNRKIKKARTTWLNINAKKVEKEGNVAGRKPLRAITPLYTSF